MLHLNDISLRLAGRLLLEGATVHLPAGQRVALIGRNGSGKTTLLRLIRGELQPDLGEVRLQRRARIGWVAQEAPGGDASPRATVLAADEERAALLLAAEKATSADDIAETQTRLAETGAHAAPSRASIILSGLGFDEAAQQEPLSSFSGGWRMRVALAAALFAEPDLLLLDEPTNHLDLEASLWLESYLRRYPKTLLLVSHDRDLLNKVPERIIHLDQLRLTAYAGGYDSFERIRREKLVLQEKERVKIDAKRKHMQAFVDRFRYKASKASQAQSRLKALAKLEPVAAVLDPKSVVLSFPETPVPPPPLLTFDGVDAGYGETVILRDLDLRIDPDDRIALLGANGNGKSTFAKLISDRLAPLTGEMVRPPKLQVGYFAQHQIEELDADRSALKQIADVMPHQRPERHRAHLASFGLGEDKATLPAGKLSGGEKARLTFAIISAGKPQLLVLDEPTNHLDIESRAALIEAINGFAGAVVLISHDRHLLEHTADGLWLVADGKVKPFEGDLDDYRRLLLGAGSGQGEKAKAKKAKRQKGPEARAKLAKLRAGVKEAEREFERLSKDHEKITAKLGDQGTYDASKDELETLMRSQNDLAIRIEHAESRWLKASEALEQADV